MPKTEAEKVREKNARANKVRREVGHLVGSPFREHQIAEGKEPMPREKAVPDQVSEDVKLVRRIKKLAD